MKRIIEYFLCKPGKLSRIGKYTALFGAFLLLAGAWGNFVTGAINIIPTFARSPASAKTLVDIYPTLPLWWVPESLVGVIVAVLLLVVGFWTNTCGRRLDRFL